MRRLRSILPPLLLAAVGAAQAPIAGIVHDRDGAPAAGARITLLPRPPLVPAGLAELVRSRFELRTLADARGQFVLRPDDPDLRGGTLLVEHGGQAALVAAVDAGSPTRVALAESAVVGAAIDGPGTLHVLALFAQAPVLLGSHPIGAGAAVALPAARYRLLLEAAGRFAEHEIELRAGERAELPAPPEPVSFLRVPSDFAGRVHPAGWFPVALPVRDHRVAVPAGPPPRALVAHLDVEQATVVQRVAFATGGEQTLAPVRGAWHTVAPAPGSPSVRGWLFSVEPLAEGLAVRCFARAPGPVRLLATSPRDAFLLWFADHAPIHAAAEGDLSYTATPGATLDLELDAADVGEDLRADVTVTGPEMPWLQLRTAVDARGRARLPDLPPGLLTVRVTSALFQDETRAIELRSGGAATLRIAPRRGARLTGTAFLPDGAPAVGAVAELRDPSGAQRTEPWRTFTDSKGGFAFAGLPAEGTLTLWVSLQQAGRTWSAQLRGVQPGEDCRLDLRLEDPAPPSIR